MRLTWAQPEDLIAHELVQSAAEGTDVADVAARWAAAGGDLRPAAGGAGAAPATPALRALARELLTELQGRAAPESPTEPDDWSAISALLPPAPRIPAPDASMLEARLRGAWTGRAAGCLLGKPVEKIPRRGIEEILRATDRWPLDGYFTAVGLPDDVAARWPWNRRSAPTSLVENIDGMPEDDDLNFAILALDLIEGRGVDFSTDDVATAWLDNLPAGRVFTAERAAYRNILDARPVPETATHLNPFREWIGALIRADVHGWVMPGDVRGAAHLAWKDARLSHTRNGLYGAMWAAALCSAALVCTDVDEVLDAAQTVLPPDSRLAAAVRRGREVAAQPQDVADGLDTLHAEYGHLHWVHVINNAAVIAYALARGGGRFGPSVSVAVTAGWDTDSAGATVGSVVGGLLGAEAIGQRWTAPLDGRIATSLPGPAWRPIDDLASRTLRLARGVAR
ncbi:ADP-ribosylglycohydrolase family protein [Cellulomonas sp. KRMCY2]|uniref:ADP-ribosylglycohydrolase family protein n=1 Tax=Cellulomonas sp. KRMCY2 TaxID=1304865 RepID=UPI00045E6188|nr:ADP-ribosylglycohydrolase family protein [Cellulomonas sp. KRMCY2]